MCQYISVACIQTNSLPHPGRQALEISRRPHSANLGNDAVPNTAQSIASQYADRGRDNPSDCSEMCNSETGEVPKPSADAEDQHGLMDTAKVTQAAANHSTRWVFGYGSLIWKVDFPFENQMQCAITGGFQRRFWMKSCDHRGTPQYPGRVVTLVQLGDDEAEEAAEAGTVAGVAYQIPEEGFADTMKQLDFRERHGYTRTVASVVDKAGVMHEVMADYPPTVGIILRSPYL